MRKKTRGSHQRSSLCSLLAGAGAIDAFVFAAATAKDQDDEEKFVTATAATAFVSATTAQHENQQNPANAIATASASAAESVKTVHNRYLLLIYKFFDLHYTLCILREKCEWCLRFRQALDFGFSILYNI